MKCFVCRNGDTKLGRITYHAERDGRSVLVRDVPAAICNQCGEDYIDIEVSQVVYDIAERELARGEELQVTTYVI